MQPLVATTTMSTGLIPMEPDNLCIRTVAQDIVRMEPVIITLLTTANVHQGLVAMDVILNQCTKPVAPILNRSTDAHGDQSLDQTLGQGAKLGINSAQATVLPVRVIGETGHTLPGLLQLTATIAKRA